MTSNLRKFLPIFSLALSLPAAYPGVFASRREESLEPGPYVLVLGWTEKWGRIALPKPTTFSQLVKQLGWGEATHKGIVLRSPVDNTCEFVDAAKNGATPVKPGDVLYFPRRSPAIAFRISDKAYRFEPVKASPTGFTIGALKQPVTLVDVLWVPDLISRPWMPHEQRLTSRKPASGTMKSGDLAFVVPAGAVSQDLGKQIAGLNDDSGQSAPPVGRQKADPGHTFAIGPDFAMQVPVQIESTSPESGNAEARNRSVKEVMDYLPVAFRSGVSQRVYLAQANLATTAVFDRELEKGNLGGKPKITSGKDLPTGWTSEEEFWAQRLIKSSSTVVVQNRKSPYVAVLGDVPNPIVKLLRRQYVTQDSKQVLIGETIPASVLLSEANADSNRTTFIFRGLLNAVDGGDKIVGVQLKPDEAVKPGDVLLVLRGG